MLHTARRIDDDEVVFTRSPYFLKLRYEMPQVSAVAQRATAAEVVFVRAPNFLEPRYEPPQGSATLFFQEQKLEFPDHFPVTEEERGAALRRFISRLKKIGRADKHDFSSSSALNHSADLRHFISQLKK